MWYVYALYNKEADKIYIGETSDPDRRVIEHNHKHGNHFTAKYSGKWILLYKEEIHTRKEALIREKQLKSYQGREFIRKLINNEGSAPL